MDANLKVALQSRPLRLAINPAQDGYYKMVFGKDGTEHFTGFCIDVINILATSLNFSYELVSPADGEWGVEHDGQWTGLMGLLQRKEADMAFLLSPSLERSVAAQWTMPMDYYYNNMVVRTRSVQPRLWAAFLSPFNLTVYIFVLVSYLLWSSFLLHVTRTEGHVLPEVQQTWSLAEVGLFLFGSVLGRGMTWSWAGKAGRVGIAGWCITGLLLTSCYTSKLTSLLVGVTPSPPFTSVREMLAQDEYRWGVLGGTKLAQILRDSNSSTEQEMYKRMMTFAEDDPEVLSRDPNVHLSKVLSEKYAFFGDSPILEIWVSDHCEITMVPVRLSGLEYYSIFLPKDSVMAEELSDVLLRLHDTGSLAYPRGRWFPSAEHCHGSQSPQQTFSLATLQGPFYAAAAGLLLAASLLCVERCGHRRDT